MRENRWSSLLLRATGIVLRRHRVAAALIVMGIVGALAAGARDDPRTPNADTEWEVWYRDTFDREAPPSRERAGVGVAKGLAFLWHRVLSEGVDDDGQASFSTFYLVWGQRTWRERAEVQTWPASSEPALAKLRRWRSAGLCRELGEAHERLLRRSDRYEDRDDFSPGQESLAILAAAIEAEDEDELRRRLEEIGR